MQSTGHTFPTSSPTARWLRLNVSFMFSWRKSASLIKLNTKIYSVHCSTTLHRVFLYIKVEFDPSFLPIGKLGREMCPVDCVITRKNYFFAPKIKFTQTATWHGIRVKAEINKSYLDTNPIKQCGASASEDLKLRRCGKVLPTIVWCVEKKPRFRCGVWAAKIFCAPFRFRKVGE